MTRERRLIDVIVTILCCSVVPTWAAPNNLELPTNADCSARCRVVLHTKYGDHGIQRQLSAINSQSAFDRFINRNNDAIQRRLKQAQVDFSRETLVLFAHGESSGSNPVSLSMSLRDTTLVCNINRRDHDGMGTADAPIHYFAVAVKKSEIAAVEVQINGIFRDTLRLTTATSGNDDIVR